MRTPEEITAELEARFAELKREAEAPEIKYPCRTCVHCLDVGYSFATCSNALVVGFGDPVYATRGSPQLALCGPEKALWEPVPAKPALAERFINALEKLVE